MLWSTVTPAMTQAVVVDFQPAIGQEVMYKNPNDAQTPPRRARVTSVDTAKGWCWIEFLEFFPSAHNRQEYCPFAHVSPRDTVPAVVKNTTKGRVDVASTLARRTLW